jgi:two-component system chemotaxis sensor kinase CheA
MDLDEDILQDFLVEAGEIIELLQEQLVDLENNPEDSDLLNAIFRGYHTIKGGAGFLSLTPMVEVCHGAENLFDLLRQGKVDITSELMDIILEATDTVNRMFAQLQAREEVDSGEPELISSLNRLAGLEDSTEAAAPTVDVAAAPDKTGGSIDEMTAEEFEALLDGLNPGASSEPTATEPAAETEPAAASPPAKGDITDEEFEKLLDELQEDKNSPTAAAPAPAPAPAKEAAPISPPSPAGQLIEETPKPAEKPTAKPKPKSDAPAPAPEATVRVDTARLDSIMNMVGELVLVRNRLVLLGLERSDEEMSKALSNLDLVTGDLQGAVMKTRMQPIKKVFGRFPRVVRDLSRSLDKKIALELEGEETDLDKNLVEALADPLVHLVRNSVDHGIEMPDVRAANGKDPQGTIVLSASQEGDHILLKIVDDGAGMDPDKLKNIAISRGILDEDSAARMSDNEAYNLIFQAGFSTKEEISDISGRGVGMDVVKTKISQLNGTLFVDSNLGQGTTLEIKVPLTLAIMPTLMIVVADRTFALPLSGVSEIFNLDLQSVNVVNGQLAVIVRNKAIPVFYLDEWLHTDRDVIKELAKVRSVDRKKQGQVVVVQVGTMSVGLIVDSLIGQQEVVIKPLGAMLQGTPGMAGATITSDGGIALILDLPLLLKFYTNSGNQKNLLPN